MQPPGTTEAEMERLESKRIKGHTYYYYSRWARVDNRCRRVWQKYLGKLEDISGVFGSGSQSPPSRFSYFQTLPDFGHWTIVSIDFRQVA